MLNDTEKRLLSRQEAEEMIAQGQQALADIIREERLEKKEKKQEKNILKLNFELDGNKLIKSDFYNRFAIYNYFNEKTLENTLLNGLQAESILFSEGEKVWYDFGTRKLGKIYRKPNEFILEFQYLEI